MRMEIKRLAFFTIVVAACECGGTRLLNVNTKKPNTTTTVTNNNNPGSDDTDAGTPGITPPHQGQGCAAGNVQGNACAPDQQTKIANANVEVKGTDCKGNAFDIKTTTGASGGYTLQNVPSGTWTVTVTSGAFSTSYSVTVIPNSTVTVNPSQGECFKNTTTTAVVTGSGDKIEQLLTGMGLSPTLYDGATNWATAGQPFLANLSQMEKYNIIFIDCGASKSYDKTNYTDDINSGPSTTAENDALIANNLRQFVANGGHVYASDWGFLFLALAWPDQMPMRLAQNQAMASPFPVDVLDGYGAKSNNVATVSVTASVADAGLASAMGKTSLSVAFPYGHWGLLQDQAPNVTTLLEASGVQTCAQNKYPLDCGKAGASVDNVPLAITFQPQGASGRVTYTSFHNIDQPTGDVQAFLQYLVFKL